MKVLYKLWGRVLHSKTIHEVHMHMGSANASFRSYSRAKYSIVGDYLVGTYVLPCRLTGNEYRDSLESESKLPGSTSGGQREHVTNA